MLNPQVENRTTDEKNKQIKVSKKHSKSRPPSLCSPCLSHLVDRHCQRRLRWRRASPSPDPRPDFFVRHARRWLTFRTQELPLSAPPTHPPRPSPTEHACQQTRVKTEKKTHAIPRESDCRPLVSPPSS